MPQARRIRFWMMSRYSIALVAIIPPMWAAEEPQLEKFFAQYCYECHSLDHGKADNEFDLQSVVHGTFGLKGDPIVLEDVLWMLEEKEMPPRKAEAFPTEGERERALHSLRRQLRELQEMNRDDPGRVVMARLSRGEYGNSVRALSGGMPIKIEDILPADTGAGEGFSNVGEALSIDAAQIERYLRAAERVLLYAVALPGRGLRWHAEPQTFKDTPSELREYFITGMKEWHEAAAREWVKLYVDRLEERFGMTYGVYWEAAWKYRHTYGNELSSDALQELVDKYESEALNPRLVGLWVQLLAADLDSEFMKERGHLVQRLGEWWQQLPSPQEVEAESMRALFQEKDRWFAAARDRGYQPPYETSASDKRWRQSEFESERVLSVSWRNTGEQKNVEAEAKSPEVMTLLVTDAWDGNAADYVVWRDGEFQIGTGDEAIWIPWESVLKGVHDGGGQAVAWDSEPVQGDLIERIAPGEALVRAPSALTFHVPKAASAFRITMAIDAERGKEASVQALILLDETLSEQDMHFFVREKARDVWGIGGSDRMQAYEQAMEEWRLLVWPTLRAPSHEHPWYYYDVNALGAFQQRTGLDLRYVGGPWRVAPKIPMSPARIHWVDAIHLQSEMPSDRVSEVRELQAMLDEALQLPLQNLRFFLMQRGVDEYAEGVIPPDEVAASWPQEERETFLELKRAAQLAEESYRRQARKIIHPFAELAWRRTLTYSESEPLVRIYDVKRRSGGSFDASVKMAMRGALVSPRFLFKAQRSQGSEEPYRLDALEVADRLAFALWGSLPDRELIQLAESGALDTEAAVAEQAARMLREERVRGLATEFAGVWFKFRDFQEASSPATEHYTSWDPLLAEAMEEEAVRFFTYLFRNDRPIDEVFTADYVFANEALAEHYGLELEGSDEGQGWQRLAAPDARRGGILGMSSVLTRTSEPIRTSPVRRGVWLLEDVLGEELPPPPPDVPALSDGETDERGFTIAEQLERHRADVNCSSCHDRIDPLGLALENFDGIGYWRETLGNGAAVESTSVTHDGHTLQGVEGLKRYISQMRREDFTKQFCRKLLGYSLGRSVTVGDAALLRRMEAALEENGNRPSAAVREIVTSQQFLYRRDRLAEPAELTQREANHE